MPPWLFLAIHCPVRAGGLAQAVDMMGDALAVGDIVTVSQGEFKGASGTIKHIHRVHVFLYDFK